MSDYIPPPPDVVKAIFARVRQRGSRMKFQRNVSEPTINDVIEAESELSKLNDVAELSELRDLMIKKLRLCCVVFHFKKVKNSTDRFLSIWNRDQDEEQGKEAKGKLLVELTQLVTDSERQWFSEEILIEVLHMTAVNLFRALPPTQENYDPEEDDAIKDPAWQHIQMVYEFLFYFMVSQQTKPDMMHKHLSESYIKNLIKLFKSKDSTERDYLKNILHRIYQRFLGFRPFIRSAIGKALYWVTYEGNPRLVSTLPSQIVEQNSADWIVELLGVWGTIVAGFSSPIQAEHIAFLRKIMIPLHKNRSLKHYHHHLSYCILQYVDKEPSLCTPVIQGLLKYWPTQSSEKELLFIQELEEILDLSSRLYLLPVLSELFKQIGLCIQSEHFQVSERALYLWNKDVVATLTADYRDSILPILLPAITQMHWNGQVNELNRNIVRMFKDMDAQLWERTEKAHENNHVSRKKKREDRLRKWEKLRTTGIIV